AEPFGRAGQTLPEKGVRRAIPTGQVRRVHVPALVDAALEGPSDQTGMKPPCGAYRIAVAYREHVCGAVGNEHPGACGGDLHDSLGLVGDRMLEALVLGRDA